MSGLISLKPGDAVNVIAPASACSSAELQNLCSLLETWRLQVSVPADIFEKDLLCSNSDVKRYKQLEDAIVDPDTKAIICVRGGYGSLRLIPYLSQLALPSPKLFLGMSDITALHLYFQQRWGWPTLHGSLNTQRFTAQSIAATKDVLFGENAFIFPELTPLNTIAGHTQRIEAHISGGNLSIVQTSLGTPWQIQAANKIILLEEINERAYRVDRMLEHLRQTGVFDQAAAILLGDFLGGEEPNGSALIPAVLQRFAESCSIPVLQIKGVGHGPVNLPIPFGIDSVLELGSTPSLTFFE